MNKDKIEELIAASKLNELLHKKDVEESKKKSNVIIIVLAVIGAVAALAAIVYAIYPLSWSIQVWKEDSTD